MSKRRTSSKKPEDRSVRQEGGGVYIEGDVTHSQVAGRDLIQMVYSYLPVPDVVKKNATKITLIYAAICELLAILATIADIRAAQQERYPAFLMPSGFKPPLPPLSEIVGLFLKNNVLFFALGVLVAIGLIAALWYIQRERSEPNP